MIRANPMFQSLGCWPNGKQREHLESPDQVTQQNAALVEQTATASQRMDEQSRELQQLIAFFQLENQQLLADAVAMNIPDTAREDSSQLPTQLHASHQPETRVWQDQYFAPATIE